MSLSGNTEKLNELLSKINALPEAGSGGGSGGGGATSETASVTFKADFYISADGDLIYYRTENGCENAAVPTMTASVTFQCSVPSLICAQVLPMGISINGDAEMINNSGQFRLFYVTGDATITIKG